MNERNGLEQVELMNQLGFTSFLGWTMLEVTLKLQVDSFIVTITLKRGGGAGDLVSIRNAE